MFFIFTALFIISNNNIYILEEKGSEIFYKEYNAWLDKVYSNFRTLTGNVVQMEWLPTNSSSDKFKN